MVSIGGDYKEESDIIERRKCVEWESNIFNLNLCNG